MSNNIEHVAVDLGYGFVKAIASTSGKRVIFPSLVGKGYDLGVAGMFGDKKNDISNIFISYDQEDYFVGTLAEKESRTVSRIFEQERFEHLYTKILLNTAIQIVTEGKMDQVNVSTGLPLDFYQAQRKEFQQSILGLQPLVEWKSGELKGETLRINVNQALVFPQGASAVFSALINHEGKFTYPHLMNIGNLIALIDIGFRTTDYIVVEMQEDSSFVPKVKLSGTIDEGAINLYQDIKQFYKRETGGADLNEFHMSRILKNGFITYKGKRINFNDAIESSKKSIATNISDRLKVVWVDEADLFDAIFLAGGGGILFEQFIQPHFDNRLEIISESQFANTIGYLRLGKRKFNLVRSYVE
ncbi:ParM/StbA family protein [Lentibacillus sp. N15]|uniref:ParM/StbA family protein n=1 Tax=Lentibacillus songyuanensis TaxID=3136161 RepID=UPI0031BB9BEB